MPKRHTVRTENLPAPAEMVALAAHLIAQTDIHMPALIGLASAIDRHLHPRIDARFVTEAASEVGDMMLMPGGTVNTGRFMPVAFGIIAASSHINLRQQADQMEAKAYSYAMESIGLAFDGDRITPRVGRDADGLLMWTGA